MKLSEYIRQDGLGWPTWCAAVNAVITLINLTAQLESSMPWPRVAPLAHAAAG